MKIQVDENISLQILDEVHAESLMNLINLNRQHLRQWLPWVDHMHTTANAAWHITDTKKRAAEKTDFGFAIIIDNNIAGKIGLHHISYPNKIAEIGYWLAAGVQGKGVITKSCKAIINHAFNEMGLNRIEIKCGIDNDKSGAIPKKLQFKQEGILRQAELLNGKFIDLYLYAMLKEEWKVINP